MYRGGASSGLTLSLAVFTVVSCSANAGDGEGDAACAFTLTYKGQTYVGEPLDGSVKTGRSLGSAVREPCADGNSAGERSTSIPVSAIKGVSPKIAFVTTDPKQRYIYYVGVGRFRDPPAEIADLTDGR